MKAQFGLTANHVVRACARVGANRLTAKQKRRKVKGFKPTSFDCDARTFRMIEDGYLVSLSTTGKRVKVPMRVSNYHRGKLKGQKPTSAQVCQHRDGNFYIHIQLKYDAPKIKDSENVIGVDFGRRDIACTSTGQSWSGTDINKTRDQYARTRASLQKKASQGKSASPGEGLTAVVDRAVYTQGAVFVGLPRSLYARGWLRGSPAQFIRPAPPRVSPGVYAGRTRSTRRRCRKILKRLSGRERRYQGWLNHNISSSIIREATATNATVAIEDLTGIRESTNSKPRNKTERRRSNSWAFYQLRTCAIRWA